jgi:hypothetical protein
VGCHKVCQESDGGGPDSDPPPRFFMVCEMKCSRVTA